MNFLHKIPFFAHDFISNEVFPFEINLNSALNYSKGCYIGQEVITRTKFRGAVRKGIYRVAIDCAKTSSFARNKLLYTNAAGKEKSAGRLLGEYTKYMSAANNPRKYSASDSDFARGNDIQMDSNSAFHAAATSTAPLSILNSRQPLDIGMQNCQNSTENTLLSQTSHNTSAHTLINMNVSTDNEQQSDHTEQNIAHPADVIPIDVHINASPQSIDLHKSGEHGDSSEVTRKYFLALISDSAIASIDSLKIANSE
jgi:folate-binding protein YgfZ